jgi:hypothetical protein
LRGDIFADVPAFCRPPDHFSDCVPDHIVPVQEVGEAFEIAVLRRAHACALLFQLQDATSSRGSEREKNLRRQSCLFTALPLKCKES